MRLNEFRCWLDGFEHAFLGGHPSAAQWLIAKEKIADIESDATALLEDEESDVAHIDRDILINLCDWLGDAIKAKGAQRLETNVSPVDGDVIFELEGSKYVAVVRPLLNDSVAA